MTWWDTECAVSLGLMNVIIFLPEFEVAFVFLGK